jgi:hypothetical protein
MRAHAFWRQLKMEPHLSQRDSRKLLARYVEGWSKRLSSVRSIALGRRVWTTYARRAAREMLLSRWRVLGYLDVECRQHGDRRMLPTRMGSCDYSILRSVRLQDFETSSSDNHRLALLSILPRKCRGVALSPRRIFIKASGIMRRD